MVSLRRHFVPNPVPSSFGRTCLASTSKTPLFLHTRYDGFDKRIGVSEDPDGAGGQAAVQRWTAYDGVNPYADFDGSGNLTHRYLYGPAVDMILARFSASGTIAWQLTDDLGSVRDLANTSGQVIDHVKYDSFGRVLYESQPSNGDRFKYTARELDANGLYYYRARYYDAAIGRFLREDPLRFGAGDSNLYRYVGNAPTAFLDPSGLELEWSTIHDYKVTPRRSRLVGFGQGPIKYDYPAWVRPYGSPQAVATVKSGTGELRWKDLDIRVEVEIARYTTVRNRPRLVHVFGKRDLGIIQEHERVHLYAFLAIQNLAVDALAWVNAGLKLQYGREQMGDLRASEAAKVLNAKLPAAMARLRELEGVRQLWHMDQPDEIFCEAFYNGSETVFAETKRRFGQALEVRDEPGADLTWLEFVEQVNQVLKPDHPLTSVRAAINAINKAVAEAGEMIKQIGREAFETAMQFG